MTNYKFNSAERGFIMILIKAFIEKKPISRTDYDETFADTVKKVYNRFNEEDGGTFRYSKKD